MPNDDLTFFERLRGKRMRDVNLPSEGKVDPRLKGKSVRDAYDKMGKGWEILKKHPSLEALKDKK